MPRAARRRKTGKSQTEPSGSGSGGTTCHVGSVSVASLYPDAINAPVPLLVDRTSNDRRRVYREEIPVQPPSPMKRQRLAAAAEAASGWQGVDGNFSFEGPSVGERYELFFEGEEPAINVTNARPKRPPGAPRIVKPSDPSLHNWKPKRDLFVMELLRWYGTRDVDFDVCPRCVATEQSAPAEAPRFRCSDCYGGVLYCKSCIVKGHRENPLHSLWEWQDVSFVRVHAARLGLRVQLGHPPHEPCAAPEPARSGFVILHLNGIHEVCVDYCGCERMNSAGPPEVQLLRVGWYPATHERPQTCASFAVLEKFQEDTLQGRTSMYDFYAVLERLTDDTGIKPPDRYHKWLRMCREWAHLHLLMRGGRAIAYSASGAEGTKQGELAVECPACPRPGVNLPEGWEKAPAELRFLYTLFLALDACFRLKRRLISSELRDPDLSPGWAYMVETGPYREYLGTVTDQKEMNSCTGLAALDYANTKFSRGYSTTGVGMGVCARHEFVQPNGVGDLQKGERFANMDYIFASILKHKDWLLFKMISYDIVCSWSKYLVDRLKKLPPNVRMYILLAMVRFAVPKMHIHSHTQLCQLLFSLNLIIGSAQLDGEGVERVWSVLGALAACTRDRGPGSRHDMLDTHIAHHNWIKLLGIVTALRKRKDRAVVELKEQQDTLDWRQSVLDYEADDTRPSPYCVAVTGLTEAQVRLQFAEEEAEEAARGVPLIHDVSPSSFITAALDLEEEQRQVRVQAELKKAGTTLMQINLRALRTKLNRGIARFRKLQQAYMPVALQALGKKNLPAETLAEDVPLLLPSALSSAERACCYAGLEQIEGLMRDAQCHVALVGLCSKLHIKSKLLTYKRLHTRHQGSNTRARTIVTRNETKIRLQSEKYQAAWEAMRALNGGDTRKVGWHVLKRADIRCMQDKEDLAKKARRQRATAAWRERRARELREEGMLPAEEDEDDTMDWEDADEDVGDGPENKRQISWIWAVAGTTGSDADLDDALCAEWAKAFARTRRWGEEDQLVVEEYRRVNESFEFEACKWEARAASVPVALYRDLVVRGRLQWTEERLPRGKKKARHMRAPPAIAAAERGLDAAYEEAGAPADSTEQEGREVRDARRTEWVRAMGGDSDAPAVVPMAVRIEEGEGGTAGGGVGGGGEGEDEESDSNIDAFGFGLGEDGSDEELIMGGDAFDD
ncbi:hypothetical protein B0H15DRAFT_954431 [Mycena belliarum]|uniref:CxC2-like cysteine cluster KDZ transposase-associated domain-containing protein n=1 Tax=Mycena belliarum TaxID=1033014 RepID=A0AAD6TT95_9AGAR|nr:hypothetical protein B0H15DRAFT_954431 [Mycena belliae]